MFFLTILPYVGFQVYAPIRCRGRWPRALALLPLAWMTPVVVFTITWFNEGGNLWPCLLMPACVLSLLYLAVVVYSHESSRGREERRGFDVGPPSGQPAAGRQHDDGGQRQS